MVRWGAGIAMLVLVTAIMACSSDDATPSLEATPAQNSTTTATAAAAETTALATTAAETPVPERTTFAIGESATTAGGNRLVIHGTNAEVVSPFFTPKPGERYFAVDVEGCAADTNTQAVALNPFDFQLQMPDNTRRQADLGIAEPALGHIELGAGDCVRGWVTFAIPVDTDPATVNFQPLLGGAAIKWTVQ